MSVFVEKTYSNYDNYTYTIIQRYIGIINCKYIIVLRYNLKQVFYLTQ